MAKKKQQQEQEQEKIKTETSQVDATEVKNDVLTKVKIMLKESGLSNEDISKKISMALGRLPQEILHTLTVEQLHAICLQQISANDAFITKTGNGNPGVAVMTETASQKGDAAPIKPRQTPDYIYKLY